ncbi:MAG: beta-galactosidase [Clostridiales bacterium]|nr:beta-galactosidase [Clostridiales bacterium]
MLYYGAAYYTEYLPAGRTDADMQMMRDAGLNVIRIAESTWATYEPREGEFDFTPVAHVLDKATEYGLQVIIGTPTYAIPAWLQLKCPSVMADTHQGRRPYGARQIMDITDPDYLFYSERIIRKLMEVVRGYDCVIGFQLDNETKHYDTCSQEVQKRFVASLKEKYGSTDKLNDAFGLNYWSNRIGSWDEFPDVRGTINASLGCAYAAFQRQLVTEFLQWQADIVREYAKPNQFVTHNFDFEWRGYSFGVQPDVDHNKASKCLTMAGCDIYHPTQDHLTGREIAFCGDITRCLKHAPYLVLETEAQGFPQWTPYPNQLRLQAFSHIASGARGVMYWHWHSLHNAFETYWKGLLSHDLEANPTYDEAATVGADFAKLSDEICGLQKHNRAAMLVSNTALSAVNAFRIPTCMPFSGKNYNDMLRPLYDACYDLNLELDIIFEDADLSAYELLIVPCLYAAADELIARLREYVQEGGHLLATFKTGFTDENVRVRAEKQPAGLTDVFGCTYSQFTIPEGVTLCGGSVVSDWMELLEADTAEAVENYQHPQWGNYAAVTRNAFGQGTATYLGCMPDASYLRDLITYEAKSAGLDLPEYAFPLVCKRGIQGGKRVTFLLNYSQKAQQLNWDGGDGTELLSDAAILSGAALEIAPWDFIIIKEANVCVGL